MSTAILKHLSQFKPTNEEHDVLDSLIPEVDQIVLAAMHLPKGPLKIALNLAASLILDRIAEKAMQLDPQFVKRGRN